mmetsp:Transcript_12803/g.26948  ORF Transcript_12803/g.26948 Transcript_12803/m.26948 type:complete len:351 (-) Transcript_12803:58-1110(-)
MGVRRLRLNRCLVVTAVAVISEETTSLRGGFLFFFLLFFFDRSCRGIAAATASTGSGEFRRILEVFLVLIGLGKAVGIELDGDRQDHLECVDEGVGNGSLGRESGGQRDGGQDSEGLAELGGEDIVGDLQYLGIEEGSVVVDGLERHTVQERADVELLQKSGLGGGDLVSLDDQVGIGNHLNLTTGNLGGDLKGLEKGGLTGITSGGSLFYDDISGGNGSNLGRGGTGVGLQDFLDGTEITVGEDESDVPAALIDELDARGFGVLLDVFLDTLSHHSVLSHQDLGLSTKCLTGVLELLGTNIVDFYNEALGVCVQEVLELGEVRGLALGGKRHVEGVLSFGLKKGKSFGR